MQLDSFVNQPQSFSFVATTATQPSKQGEFQSFVGPKRRLAGIILIVFPLECGNAAIFRHYKSDPTLFFKNGASCRMVAHSNAEFS